MKHFLAGLVPQSIKNIFWHLPQAIVAVVWYGFPGKRLTLIGVTGTNGKTTTTQMIGAILTAAGKKVALASTINFRIAGHERSNASKFTTQSPWQLQRFLRQAIAAGCSHAVLEISSHALDQFRTWGLRFEVAVITNVTREHLDYHQTMERYTRAKMELFKKARRAAVNLDLTERDWFLGFPYERLITYSVRNAEADLHAEKIELEFASTRFLVGGTEVTLQLPGYFNIENALAALAVARLCDIPDEISARALASMLGVPGRMESVPNDRGIDILIDYAVTPDALEKLYQSILPMKIPGTKIYHIFGACGERDRGKRPDMSRIVNERADLAISTTEDPYYEDQEQIFTDLERGVVSPKKYRRIPDRREAIRTALSLAERGDIVLVTGKGAEETMAIRGERLPWREREVILEELAKLSSPE